ncbi:putative Sporulation domain protein [Candidatus Filomicrobium marinum]|uniref:Putative Sporulation domain protein n=1 Tax=Candidatus Filomicrobium marinum TaxID=1608628 RepID=A0A0D6JGS2_9HYPH|nr:MULTISPECIES: SPOR domain-containing protein [Filomicrobium]MCV0369713.1 SPOR domain-containing protein [Filomicrobium sp.]CFX48564.1 putative Sporulation domain protein [Candidatus Filomicrobium marinum]CPR20419.1 putative Sporulation domain protein [Candidatus Filomicrobium marinum]
MARSDGYGTRPGHPAPQQQHGHPLDQSAAPQHGQQNSGWPNGQDYGGQYPQDPYWQQPVPPQGRYEPVAPGGYGQPIEPVPPPDPRYPSAPQHNPYGGGQDGYHYPQAPGFEPYDSASQPSLGIPNQGNPGAGYGAPPEFPSYPEPALGGYAPPYEPQQYQPTREPHLDPGRGYPAAGDMHGQFQDYLQPTAPSMPEEPVVPGYPDLGSRNAFDTERPGLRGSEFEDWPRNEEQGNHDFGGYDPSSQFTPAAAAHGEYADGGWGQQEAGSNFALDSGPIFASAGYDATQDLALHAEYDDEEEYEDDEPAERPRSRIGWIVMALVGTVMIGGAMAYGYKIVVGPSATQVASTPVVKGASQPPKVRPEDPGGRSFDHTDSKILGRLSEPRNSGAADDGSRRVSTVMIGRNGDIVTPRSAPTPSETPPNNPVVAVPGLTLVDGFGGAATRPPVTPTAATNTPQQPIVVQPPASTGPRSPARPVVITRDQGTSGSSSAAPPPAAKPADTSERVTSARVAAAAPKNTAPVTTASTGPSTSAAASAGYVAVLASVPVSTTSRVDALAQYADLQQNYSSVLGSRTPDVREANLGSRGRYHRLMVGPPGSKESAAQLCSQLKVAGYSGCWITTY